MFGSYDIWKVNMYFVVLKDLRKLFLGSVPIYNNKSYCYTYTCRRLRVRRWDVVSLVPDAQPWTRSLGSASMLGPNCVIAKKFKSCTFFCYVICATIIIRVGEMSGRNSLPCNVDFQTKVLQLKECVFYIKWPGSMIYWMGLWTSARCVVSSLVMVRMAIELKYSNTHGYIFKILYFRLVEVGCR